MLEQTPRNVAEQINALVTGEARDHCKDRRVGVGAQTQLAAQLLLIFPFSEHVVRAVMVRERRIGLGLKTFVSMPFVMPQTRHASRSTPSRRCA